MRKAVLAIAVLASLTLTTVPAQAHFEHGVNCHIENVTNRGTVTFRITNRLYDAARVECLVRFSTGSNGYYRTNVPARRQIVRRWTYGGPWEWVKITHAHIIRTY